MDSSIQTYRLQPDGLQKRLRNNMKRIMLFAVPLAAVSMVFLSLIMIQNGNEPYSIVILLSLVFGYTFFRMSRQKITPDMQAAYDSYLLTVHDYSITRVYLGLPTVTIPLKSIRSITMIRSGTLQITSADNSEEIFISKDVENYDQLVLRLKAIVPIEETVTYPFLQWLPTIILLVGFAGFGGMLMTRDKLWVGIAATVCIAAGAYSFFWFRNSPKLPAQFRKTQWYLLGMIGLALYYLFLIFTDQA